MGDKSNWLTFRKLRFSIFNLSFYIIFIQRYFSENPTTILEIKKINIVWMKGGLESHCEVLQYFCRWL